MVPKESLLEQQRRLLASIEHIEHLIGTGRVQQCRALIVDFATDLAEAADSPILIHLHARFDRIRDRVNTLGWVLPAAQQPRVRHNDSAYDPLAQYRGDLGEAVPAPDLNEGRDFVPETAYLWWRCSRDTEHPAWKATGWQALRGRPCPTCVSDAGLRTAWYPTDTAPGRWDVLHYLAMRRLGPSSF